MLLTVGPVFVAACRGDDIGCIHRVEITYGWRQKAKDSNRSLRHQLVRLVTKR